VLVKKIHVSWCIAVTSGSFVVGVAIAPTWQLFTWWWFVVATICVVVGFFLRRVSGLPFLIVGAVIGGCWYGSMEFRDSQIYTNFFGADVHVVGRIREDPTQRNGATALQLDRIVMAGIQLEGQLWTNSRDRIEVKRGDIITVQGIMDEGFGSFSAAIYSSRVIAIERPVLGDVGRVVRDWFADAVRVGIKEPQASLGVGYLTGQKSALPEDLSQSLQIAGLTHIVVASGYNLTILVRLARRLFARVSKYLSTMSAAFMIVSFVAMTGLSPSMTRAGLVAGLSLLAWYYGRAFHPFILLPFAAAITVLFQPSYAWGDLGWQLSFAAFAGVMVVAPLFQRYFFGKKEPGTLRQVLGETVAAHIVTVPIIVPAFGLLSNVAIIANLLIVPLVPLAMLLTFIVGVVALIIPAVAAIVALPATWLLTYMTETATFLAELPWAQTELVMGEWIALPYYAALGGICWYMWRVTKFSLRNVNVVE